jgi:hypothetical protein
MFCLALAVAGSSYAEISSAAEVDFKIRLRPKKKWWRQKPKDADKKYSGDEGFAGGN